MNHRCVMTLITIDSSLNSECGCILEQEFSTCYSVFTNPDGHAGSPKSEGNHGPGLSCE